MVLFEAKVKFISINLVVGLLTKIFIFKIPGPTKAAFQSSDAGFERCFGGCFFWGGADFFDSVSDYLSPNSEYSSK